jgi:hypothetical protein
MTLQHWFTSPTERILQILPSYEGIFEVDGLDSSWPRYPGSSGQPSGSGLPQLPPSQPVVLPAIV